jgi:nucleotide-binding universal stress UspA family protein
MSAPAGYETATAQPTPEVLQDRLEADHQPNREQPLVVATDGSPSANAAAAAAVELARDLETTPIFAAVHRAPMPVLGEPFYQQQLSESQGAARAALDQAREAAERAGVAAEYELLAGDPVEQILRLADNRNAQLIIVGSRGLGRIGSIILGSVSRALVRNADRPVVVVTAPS